MNPFLMDPTGRSAEKPEELAARAIHELDGKVVGLLDSSKPNSGLLLDNIAEMLQARYNIKEFVRRRKPMFSLPAPNELVDEMADSCDVVITGVGD